MKWLTKSESYLRHPKTHLVNLRQLLTQNWRETTVRACLGQKKKWHCQQEVCFPTQKKGVLVRSRAQQKNRNLSSEVKKVWIKPQFSWKLDLLIASFFHCQNRHLTEQKSFQYCYRANISTLVILGDMFNYHQKLDSHHLAHLVSHSVVSRGRWEK